jgi:hypothetical protein
MLGKVDRVWQNEREDGSTYWAIRIDGVRYTTWDRKLAEGIQPGDPVEFAFTNAGKYRQLTALRRTSETAPGNADRAQTSVRRTCKVRLSCLRTAAALVADTNLQPEQRASLAIALADRFEQHVLGAATTQTQQDYVGAADTQIGSAAEAKDG